MENNANNNFSHKYVGSTDTHIYYIYNTFLENLTFTHKYDVDYDRDMDI